MLGEYPGSDLHPVLLVLENPLQLPFCKLQLFEPLLDP
jgi:hypothetical protein